MHESHPFVFRFPLLLTALLLSACANNPYVANTRPYVPNNNLTRGSLDYAMAYGEQTYEAYEAKLSEEFSRQQNLSTGLITSTALIIGLSAGHAHPDAIKLAALGSGLTYELGTWNTNQGRSGIYMEGMKAVSCARNAAAPLRLSSDQRSSLRQFRAATAEAAAHLGDAMGEVTARLTQATLGTPVQTAAQNHLALATTESAQAEVLLSRAAGMESRLEGAGGMLEGKIDEIRSAVDQALNGTAASLSNLPKAITSVSDYANVFVPNLNLGAGLAQFAAGSGAGAVAGSTTRTSQAGRTVDFVNSKQGKFTAPSQAPTVEVELATATGHLVAARQALAVQTSLLNGALNPSTLDQIKASLSGCGVDAKVTGSMVVQPTTASFTAGTEGMTAITITNGTQPYSISMLDSPAKGISTNLVAGGTIVMISAAKETDAGKTYRLSVTDAANSVQIVSIAILAAPVQQMALASPTPTCSGANLLKGEMVCLIQHYLHVTEDGRFGGKTCTAFMSKWPKSYGLVNNESLDPVIQEYQIKNRNDVDELKAKMRGQSVQQGCPTSASSSTS